MTLNLTISYLTASPSTRAMRHSHLITERIALPALSCTRDKTLTCYNNIAAYGMIYRDLLASRHALL